MLLTAPAACGAQLPAPAVLLHPGGNLLEDLLRLRRVGEASAGSLPESSDSLLDVRRQIGLEGPLVGRCRVLADGGL